MYGLARYALSTSLYFVSRVPTEQTKLLIKKRCIPIPVVCKYEQVLRSDVLPSVSREMSTTLKNRNSYRTISLTFVLNIIIITRSWSFEI